MARRPDKPHWVANSVGFSLVVLMVAIGVTPVSAENVMFVTEIGDDVDGDDSVVDRLEFLGHDVEVVDHLDVIDTDPVADGFDLIVISSSSLSTNIGFHFTEEPVPVINWENALSDELLFSDGGLTSSSDVIEVIDVSHPLAGMMGLNQTGELLVRDNTSPDFHLIDPANLAPGAVVIAEEPFSTGVAIAVFDEGVEMVDGSSATATRISLYFGDLSLVDATDAGLAIFDGAVNYALFGTGGMGLLGDFNGNDVLDSADIDELAEALRNMSTDTKYDLNQDGTVDQNDHAFWVKDGAVMHSYFGDSNLDGEFGSADLVAVFTAGLFESGQAAGWAAGDWNGDGLFTSSDLVTAFSDGGYELGPRVPPAAVPEPSAGAILAVGLIGIFCRRRRTCCG